MDAHAFDIQLTRGDFLRYFVFHYFFDRWLPWGMSFGLAAVYAYLYWHWFDSAVVAGLAFLALAVGTLFAMFALGTLVYAFKLRALDPEGIVLERKHIRLDEAGLHVQGSESQADYAWSQITSVRARGRFVFLALHGADARLLWPRRDVPAGALEAAQAWLAQGAAA